MVGPLNSPRKAWLAACAFDIHTRILPHKGSCSLLVMRKHPGGQTSVAVIGETESLGEHPCAMLSGGLSEGRGERYLLEF